MTENSDLALILKLFPECPRVEQLPAIDVVVCEYLRRRDVNITPVSSDLQPSRMTNAVMGAMGAGYLAANTHLTVQQRSAKLQEWTSWKQWAMSQPDFHDFKMHVLEKFNTAQERQDQWLMANQSEIEMALSEHRVKIEKKRASTRKIVLALFGLLIALNLLMGLLNVSRNTSPSPNSTQQKQSIN